MRKYTQSGFEKTKKKKKKKNGKMVYVWEEKLQFSTNDRHILLMVSDALVI